MTAEWGEFADMLSNLREAVRGRLDDHDLMALATMVALQEVCGDITASAEQREPIDANSKRMYAGRCTLTLLGVSDALIEQMRTSLLKQHPKGAHVIPMSNWRQ